MGGRGSKKEIRLDKKLKHKNEGLGEVRLKSSCKTGRKGKGERKKWKEKTIEIWTGVRRSRRMKMA